MTPLPAHVLLLLGLVLPDQVRPVPALGLWLANAGGAAFAVTDSAAGTSDDAEQRTEGKAQAPE